MASDLYNLASHVPFMAKFVVFAKRTDLLEARLRVFCMTDDKEDKTLEHQEHFTEVAKSRDVEVLQGRTIHVEFGGNLIPIAKSGEQLKLEFNAFKENRLPFTVRVRDPDESTLSRILFMREPKVARGEPSQQPICTLNITLPDNIVPESAMSESDLLNLDREHHFLRDHSFAHTETIQRADIRLSDISNLLGEDWSKLAKELNISEDDILAIEQEYEHNPCQQALVMLKLWMKTQGHDATGNTLEKGLRNIDRHDIVNECIYNVEIVTDDMERAVAKVRLDQSGFDTLKDELGPSRDSTLTRSSSRDKKEHYNNEKSLAVEDDTKFLSENVSPSVTPTIQQEPISHWLEPNSPEAEPISSEIEPISPQLEHVSSELEPISQESEPLSPKSESISPESEIEPEPISLETEHKEITPVQTSTSKIPKPKAKKRKGKAAVKEPKVLVNDFLSHEITNSSKLTQELSHNEEAFPIRDGTGWEKHLKTGNGNIVWEDENEEINRNGNRNTNGKQELWRSPSLEAEMIIKDVPQETRWSKKRSDSQDDSGSDYEKEMKRSNSGNNNQKPKLIPSSSGSDVAVREGTDSEEENTNNGVDLTRENSTQNINEISHKGRH